ncbi:hypothetical protein SAMN04488058_10446 [Deinococcus reticulitermitis]|uniref:Uncharacterized protein n=2 Tax=Deinococcus reticulitermitis TaxID=856736 RepID=A0A1H6WC95_9DEIO|nr:hypothetical protein SAMN04488058_10446 [Deinococcus reticulitermitis]
MYHNPDMMRRSCFEAAGSGTVATSKEGVANQIASEGGVIWCIGRDCQDVPDGEGGFECGESYEEFYLYERVDNPTVEPGDEFFDIYLVGTSQFPQQGRHPEHRILLNNKPYFGKIHDLLRKGVQLLTDPDIIADFENEFVELWRKYKKASGTRQPLSSPHAAHHRRT